MQFSPRLDQNENVMLKDKNRLLHNHHLEMNEINKNNMLCISFPFLHRSVASMIDRSNIVFFVFHFMRQWQNI